ncbi:unnamed protein product [Brassica rapa subsp. narinosa]
MTFKSVTLSSSNSKETWCFMSLLLVLAVVRFSIHILKEEADAGDADDNEISKFQSKFISCVSLACVSLAMYLGLV